MARPLFAAHSRTSRFVAVSFLALAVAGGLAMGGCRSKTENKPTGGTHTGGDDAGKSAGDKILIGHYASMTGSEATFGTRRITALSWRSKK